MGAVYTQLSMQERRRIEDWWHAKVPVAEMARQVNRHRATVSREIKRNFWADDAFPKKYAGYFGMAAHQRTQRKLIRCPELRQRILSHLKDGWTPEQIGNRMIFDGVKHRACQETIYRYIYSKEGMAQELWWYLPLHRKNRTPYHAALASVKSPSLTVMSAFFSARMMSPTGVSLGIDGVDASPLNRHQSVP